MALKTKGLKRGFYNIFRNSKDKSAKPISLFFPPSLRQSHHVTLEGLAYVEQTDFLSLPSKRWDYGLNHQARLQHFFLLISEECQYLEQDTYVHLLEC